jgi:hypothetical protein
MSVLEGIKTNLENYVSISCQPILRGTAQIGRITTLLFSGPNLERLALEAAAFDVLAAKRLPAPSLAKDFYQEDNKLHLHLLAWNNTTPEGVISLLSPVHLTTENAKKLLSTIQSNGPGASL